MAQLQSTTITGGLRMTGHSAGYMKLNASGDVVMDTSTLATQEYVSTQITNLINGAPGALDTLNELAAALGNNASFATSVTNSLATKLALAGGTMTGKIFTVSTGTGTYDGAFEIRETGYASNGQSAWGYSPAITFHWGNRYAKRFGMRSDGLFAVDDEPLALRSWVTSQGYITGSYLPLSGGTMSGVITTVSSGTAINFSGQSDSFGYNSTSGLGTYIKGTGSTYIYGGGSFYDGSAQRAILHAGNYNSYSPTLTGGNASGTWGINITGNAGYASSAGNADTVDGYHMNQNVLTSSSPTFNNIYGSGEVAAYGFRYQNGYAATYCGFGGGGLYNGYHIESSWGNLRHGDLSNYEVSADGSSWSAGNIDANIYNLFLGERNMGGSLTIAASGVGRYQRFTFAIGYKNFDMLHITGSTNGEQIYIKLEVSTDSGSNYTEHFTSIWSSWPGNHTKFWSIFNSSINRIRLTIYKPGNNYSNSASINSINYYGGYSGYNERYHMQVYSYDYQTASITRSTTISGNLTTYGSDYIVGSSNGLYLSGGNNRIYFSGYRALEGNTTGSNLQVGEGYSQTQIQSATTRIDGEIFMAKGSDPRIYAGTGVGLNIDGQALYLNRYVSSDISLVYGGGNVMIGPYTGPSFALHVKKNQNQVAGFESPNANTWIDLISTAGTWSMGATSSNTWAIYQRGATNATRFEVGPSSASLYGSTVWHQGNLTNLNQLTNGPGYITSAALGSYLPLSGGILSGNLNIQTGNNPAHFLLRGTNSELYVDAGYGGGTARLIINRQGTGNQAALHFTTGATVTPGTAWNSTGVPLWTMGMTNSSQVNDFKIAYGDIYDAVSVAVRIDTNKIVYFTNTPYVGGNIMATQSWVQSQGYLTSATVTINSGNGSASWYPIVWHSGNTLYSSSGLAEIYPAGGYARFNYINTSDNDESGITRFVIKNGDNYHRSATVATAASALSGYFIPYGNWSQSTGMNDSKLYFRTNGDNNHYLWNANDDWEELVFYTGTGFRLAGSNGGNYANFTTSAATFNTQVYISRHIDANTGWGSASGNTIFVGWSGGKVVLGNGNSGGHDYARDITEQSVVSTNPHYFYTTANFNSNVNINGGINQNNIIGRPYAVWGSTGTTGAVVIKFPGGSGNYGMVHAVIDIYEYNGNDVCTVIVGGHNWNGGWYNYGAQVIGTTNKPVRVGFKDGQYCIVIGNGSSSWSYGQVVLRKIQNGTYYSGSMGVSSGYTAAIESDSYSWISGDLRNLETPLNFYAGGNITSAYYMDVYTSAGSDYLRITDNQVYRPNGGILYLNWSSNANVAISGPSGGYVGVGNNSPSYKLHVSGDIYANGGWLRVSGSSGIYFESYAGGWRMTDSSYIRSYNAKALSMEGASVDYVGSIYMNGGVYIQTNNNRNLLVKSSGAADCGILGRGNGDQFAFQVYGSGGDYGFLGSAWGAWDIRKTVSGALYMNDNSSYYLNTNGTSELYKFSFGTLSRNGSNPLHTNSPWSTRAAQGTNYQTGAMGWGQYDLNTIGSYWGSGFFDTWSTPANGPGASSHYVGMQAMHYNDQNGNFHGWQMACAQEASNRWFWRSSWNTPRSWVEMIHSGNIGSQTVNRADGALKLWATSHPNDYYIVNNWTGSYWQLTSNHGAGVQVAYANAAGNSDTVDGLHADAFMRDLGFGSGYPSWDANSFAENRSGFTYSNNAPLTGALVYFGASGYGIQLNGNYNGDAFSIRSRNGDAGAWRPWKRILTDYNYTDYTLPRGGSWYGVNTPGSRWGGFTVSGGEIVFGDGLPNAGQMGILVDGAYLAGENNGFWSLPSDNNWNGRRGMYWDGSYLNFTTNTPTARFQAVYLDGNMQLAGKIINNGSVADDDGFGIYWGSDQDSGYAIYRQGGGWSHPYPDLHIGFHTGIKIGAYYGYNGTRFYNNSDMATITASVNDGDNNFRGYYDVIAYASDKRLKENVQVIENAIDKIRKLTGMTYTWNSIGNQYGWEPGKEREAGVFAQDVQEVLPEAVKLAPFDNDGGKSKSGENFLTVKYEKLVPLLIEAIKEQQTQIEELKSKLDGLTK